MVALDQIRTVDKRRLVKKIGRVTKLAENKIKMIIHEMLVQ